MTPALPLAAKPLQPNKFWWVVDSGKESAVHHMIHDTVALQAMDENPDSPPVLRLFQWEKPSITYGHLLDPEKVRHWAKENHDGDITERPTGGGAVFHRTTDVSFSLLWPRHQKIFPEKPRDAYLAIHTLLQKALQPLFDQKLDLFVKPVGQCDTPGAETPPKGRFSVCYDEPVCNDIMIAGNKVVGGALRLTKNAILYQGNILLNSESKAAAVKLALSNIV